MAFWQVSAAVPFAGKMMSCMMLYKGEDFGAMHLLKKFGIHLRALGRI